MSMKCKCIRFCTNALPTYRVTIHLPTWKVPVFLMQLFTVKPRGP